MQIDGGGGVGQCMDIMQNDADTSDVVTVLGSQLQGNPYSVAVMQQASINLYGHSNGIVANKLYVRFKPANAEQLCALEALDLDLYDYPLDYEVLHEGTYYPQPGIGFDEIPWYYGVVETDFQPPIGIQYEVLQQVHIPEKNLWVEQEAFRITGNPYEDSCGPVANRLPQPCDDPCNPGPGCPLPPPNCGGGEPIPPNPMVPTGNLFVWDNRLNNGRPVPVRRIRVVARNFLKTERVYTSDAGAFSFTKQFKKVTLVVKMKNNNTAILGLFGARIWNLVWPLKKNIGKYKGNLTNIQYTFFRQEDTRSRGMQDWVGVTVFNKRMDFAGLAAQDNLPAPPPYLSMFVTSYSGAASAPMFPHRHPNNNELINFFVHRYILNPTLIPPVYSFFINELARTRVDILYGYNRQLANLDSDDISEVAFHELSHAQHYNKVGNDWWHEFVLSELLETADHWNTQFDPYGPGNTIRSPIIALGESWAYHYGRILADRVYGNFSSSQVEQGVLYTNDFPVLGLSSHLNLLEDFDPGRTNDPFRWIPQGVYYDMFDNRNDLTVPFPRVLINDEVVGITNFQFFESLDPDITSLPNYRIRLLQETGTAQNIQITNLFTAYGY